jgi:hypothetical protein
MAAGSLMLDTRGISPVVIGCTGGSGSRALRDILAASPEIFLDQDCSPTSKDSRKSQTFLGLTDAPSEVVRRLIEEFMETILYQIQSGKEPCYQYFGWKNPRNLLHIDLLFHIHPELRFLHLIRDPAALTKGKRQRSDYGRRVATGEISPDADRDQYILVRWAKWNLPVWENHKDNPRYLLVRYEDMVSAPENTVRWIFEWLGVKEWRISEAIAAIAPPEDAITRADNVDLSVIAEAAQRLGYGYRL